MFVLLIVNRVTPAFINDLAAAVAARDTSLTF